MHRRNKKIWSALLCLVLTGALLTETICQQKGQGIVVYASAQTEGKELSENVSRTIEKEAEKNQQKTVETTEENTEEADSQKSENNVGEEKLSETTATEETQQTEAVGDTGTAEESRTQDPSDPSETEKTQDGEERKSAISGDNTKQRESQEREEKTLSPKVTAELTTEAGFSEEEKVVVQVTEKERLKTLKKSLNQKLKENNEKITDSVLGMEISVTDQEDQEKKTEQPVRVRLYPEDEETQKELRKGQKAGTLRLCHLKEEGTDGEAWEFLEYEIKKEEAEDNAEENVNRDQTTNEEKTFYVEFNTESLSPFLFVTTETKEGLKAENHPTEEEAQTSGKDSEEQDRLQGGDREEQQDNTLRAETQNIKAAKQNVRAGDSVKIGDLSVTLISGADKKDGKYVWTPEESTSRQQFAYSLDYSVSGELSTGKKAIQLEVPLHILKDRDGKWADTFDCPYLSLSEVTQGEEPDFVYEKDEANNKVTIYNYKDMTSGVAGFVEFGYTTNRSTMDYKDMTPSETVTATVRAKGDTEVTKQATAEPVYIDTWVNMTFSELQNPTHYTAWQTEWGAKPADADEYDYLTWSVQSYVQEYHTSPYTFSLKSVFTDLEGSVAGYRFAGQRNFSQSSAIENQRGSGYRYDYILTRHKKAAAEKVLASANAYTVTNKVTTTLTPTDGNDPAINISASRKWTYEKPVYENPGNLVSTDLWGLYGGGNYTRDDSHISDYTLREFIEGENDSIDNLRYAASMNVTPFGWSLEDGATGSYEDAVADKYGKKKVEYSYTDDSLYLDQTGKPLDDADYDFTGLNWSASMRTAVFDKTTMAFHTETVKNYEEEKK